MKSKRLAEQSIGRITSGLVEQDNLGLRTIDFVGKQLPTWRDDPDRPFEQAEPKLNSQLCDFLDSRARNVFPMVRFKHEELQLGRRSVDLSAKPVESMVLEARLYTIYDPILVLECKRLPAPSSDRKREYVTGGEKRNGGIQRFKLGLHGAGLGLVAMIGYVQKHSVRHWHREINEWISELCSGTVTDVCEWNEKEALEPLEENVRKSLAICRSVHIRTIGKSINVVEIHHLWISMDTRQKDKNKKVLTRQTKLN